LPAGLIDVAGFCAAFVVLAAAAALACAVVHWS
jgi:hypothetical protein